MTWRNRVEISYSALRRNVAAVRAAAGGRAVVAVVKADAYGIGLERCARIYHDGGVAALAVAAMLEADRIRRIVPAARVILLGSPLPEERRAVVASRYEVCCSSLDEVNEYAHLADPGEPMPVHVMVDTGMGRFGARPQEAAAMVERVLLVPALRLAGVGTHYPQADDGDFTAGQEAAFVALLANLPPLPGDCWIHYANSEGLMLRPAGPGAVVRAGLLLTGVVPDSCPDPGVEPALRWVSSLSLTKRLPKGHSISYNRTHVLQRDTLVGIVPVNYADGFPIALSNRGAVLVQGKRCPVLGRVTMDYCIIDLTDLPHTPVPGEGVVLIGQQGEERITVTELARQAGTIPYDILCGLRGRCEVVGIP
ncbi:MAG TPA: alanine racemase [Planctomycetota bacterium]|nr:alanine racemase [Planctomycetota bacterium]